MRCSRPELSYHSRTYPCPKTKPRGGTMAKGEQRSNRETKKPKKDKIKSIAAAPTMKGLMHPEPDKSRKK